MSYKIAVASSDEKQIDETFGIAKRFLIYEVTDGTYEKVEERVICKQEQKEGNVRLEDSSLSDGSDCCANNGCGTGTAGGCGSNVGSGGCSELGKVPEKIELISDCRCIVCKKIGFPIQKQLERKAISAFDVSCSVEEALKKISYYFTRMDNHQSLRIHE